MKKRRTAIILVFVILFLTWALDLRVKLNGQQTGLVSLRGHYRGLIMSFRDGWDFQDGKIVPVIFNDDGSVLRHGYRYWPRFYYLEMTNWHRDEFAINQFETK